MDNAYPFPCPNCGNYGTRRYFMSRDMAYYHCPNREVMTTECSICDYLMTICSVNGKVIETSSPPFAANKNKKIAVKQKLVA